MKQAPISPYSASKKEQVKNNTTWKNSLGDAAMEKEI